MENLPPLLTTSASRIFPLSVELAAPPSLRPPSPATTKLKLRLEQKSPGQIRGEQPAAGQVLEEGDIRLDPWGDAGR
jgi:hypothetical protein